MTMRTAIPGNPRLSDGRAVRALKGTFTQEQMFGLHKSGLFDPAFEKIMNVREHDDSLNVSNVWMIIDVNHWWRTDRYAAYRRGFEKEDLPVGDKLISIERGISRMLEVPDVPVSIIRPDGRSEIIGLRAATGMLDFDLAKLEYDPEARIVSVASDFNPETDVRVIDIMRPEGWALVDANGYPLRSMPSDLKNSDARISYVMYADWFEDGSTGYHGSVVRGSYSGCNNFSRGVYALETWSRHSGVAVVGLKSRVSGLGAAEPRTRFDEPHSQSPYRDAPGIMDSHESRVLGLESSVSGPDTKDTANRTRDQLDTGKPGMLKRLSLALGLR